jgi:transposase
MSLPRERPPPEPDPTLLALFKANAEVPRAVGRRGEFFVFFAETVFPYLEGYRDRLASLYCAQNGRPAWDPIRLLAVLVLQFVQRVGDAGAAEAVQYDARWRLALHLKPDEPTFDPTVLVGFRSRLLAGQQEAVAFEAVLDYLVGHGWMPKRSRQRLDSTHVHGLLRTMSRLECVRETLRVLLMALDRDGCLPESWGVYWERYVEAKVDPRAGISVLKAKFAEAGADMLAIWTADARAWPPPARASFELMQRVFLEHFAVEPDGRASKTRAQPPGAVQNPHEPEAQWSTKSTTKDKEWRGYKVQVAETLQDQPRVPDEPTANFLTAIVTQPAPASDKAGMAQVLAEEQRMGLDIPSSLYVDGAYVSAEAMHDAAEQGRELRGPAPASPDRGKVFTAEAFDVQVEQRQAQCPHQQLSTNCSRLEEKATCKVSYRLEWNTAVCGACPLRDQCVSAGQDHRTLVVGALHTWLQARRREMQTDAFQQEMHLRNGIEGTQSELVRAHQLRQARYRGHAKGRLQNYFIGAACNIRRLFRRTQWLTLRGQPVPGTAHAIAA